MHVTFTPYNEIPAVPPG